MSMALASTDTSRGAFASAETRQWGSYLPVSIVLLVWVVAYWPTAEFVVGEWNADGGLLSHGFLIAPIAAYLLYRVLSELPARQNSPLVIGFLATASLSFLWLLSHVATVVAVQTLVWPAVLFAALVTVYGFAAFRKLVFPFALFYLAMPVVVHAQPVFQKITVVVNQAVLTAIGTTAFFDGDFVVLASGTFEIAGGCSGLAFVLSGLALSMLYGRLFLSDIRNRILLVAVTVSVAMLGNWIRVVTIILIGDQTEMQSGLVEEHGSFGWVIFAILMIPVYLFARRIEDREAPRSEGRKDVSAMISLAAAPVYAWVLAAAAVLFGPAWSTAAESQVDPRSSTIAMPQLTGWSSPRQETWGWQPQFVGATQERVVEYRRGDDVLLAYGNVYAKQTQGSELIFFANSLSGSWESHGLVTDEFVDALAFRTQTVSSPYGSWRIWSHYVIGSETHTSDVRAKWAQALQTLRGRPSAGTFAIAARCAGADCAAADEMIRKTVSADFSALREFREGISTL